MPGDGTAFLLGERLRTALTQPAWVGDVLVKAHLRLSAMRTSPLAVLRVGGMLSSANVDGSAFPPL